MKDNFKNYFKWIIVLVIVLTSTTVSAATISYGGYPPNMYDWDYNLFSSIHGAKLGAFDAWGNPSTATVFDMTSYRDINVEPSVGYAYYLASKLNNFNSAEMQNIIWSSGQWNNESNMLDLYEGDTTKDDNTINSYRSYQYGTVYYNILKEAIDNDKNLFKINSEDDAVRVFVDQDTGEYTIGPYELALNTQYTDEAATFLYNEIIGENSGETDDTAFAKYKGITGLNGDNENAIFLDFTGNQIKFPDFVSGKDFYIRFKPNNDGAIQNTGKPVINVSYLQNFKANELVVYNPNTVQFGGTAGDYESGNFSSVSNNYNQSKFVQVSDTDIHSQYSTDIPSEYSLKGKELEDLLEDKDTYTMPGEDDIEAAGRRISVSVMGNLIEHAPIMAACAVFEIATGGLLVEVIGGKILDIVKESAVTASMSTLGEAIHNNKVKDNTGMGQNAWYAFDFFRKNVYNVDPVHAGSLFMYDNLSNQEKNSGTTGLVQKDLLMKRILNNISKMTKLGVISQNEAKYAKYLVNEYEDGASSYGQWIEAARNGYKLPLGLVMQAYGKSIGNGDVENKTVVDITELPVFDNEGKLVEDKKDFYNAKLKGTANISVSIPTDFGSTSEIPVSINVEKNISGFILRGTRGEAEEKAKNDSGEWEAVGFSGGEDYFQVPCTYLETPIKERGIVRRLALKLKNNNTFTQLDSNEATDFASGRKIVDNYVQPIEAYDSTILKDVEINMQIDGNIFNDCPEGIDDAGNVNVNGKIDNDDFALHGLEVSLCEIGKDEPVAVTTTDQNGRFSFFGLKEQDVPLVNPLKKYKIKYTYNGQIYQPTGFKNNISGLYSNAKEDYALREQYNNTFKDIYYEYNGYEKNAEWHKAYSFTEKIKKDDDSFAIIESDGKSLTYGYVYSKFLELAQQSKNQWPEETDGGKTWDKQKNYDWVLNNPSNPDSLSNWLYNMGVNAENKSIIQFIRDTCISAYTEQTYPVNNQFVINKVGQNIDTYLYDKPCEIQIDKPFTYLYTKSSDQSRYVNFGLSQRNGNNVAIQNDIFKVVTVANGKSESYIYNTKNSNLWLLSAKAVNDVYNENSKYTRKIRKSDYLYNTENNSSKNLDVYVTYKITCTNIGSSNTVVDEIVNYYDTDAYEFDGTLQNDNNTYDKNIWSQYDQDSNVVSRYYNSYIGKDEYGIKLSDDLVVKETGLKGVKHNSIEGEKYKYGSIYLTGIKSSSGNSIIKPSESAYTYVTFKVKKDNNKIKLDTENSVGKRNIAEINAYTSYYSDGTKIPQYLDDNDNVVYNTIQGDDNTSGIVDLVSTPGSLSTVDLDDNGNLITGNTNRVGEDGRKIYDYSIDRREEDIDQAPNLKLIIDEDDSSNRTIKGYTFEDSRNYTKNTGKAIIGNGTYEDGETKINGVTVELVELLPNVDENGIFKGTYSGERVWNSYTYNDLSSEANPDIDNGRYASGRYKSKIIINGPQNSPLRVSEDTLGEGEYEFKSLPPGDFYVRFKYGDTAETTMISSEKIEARRQVLQKKKDMQDPNMTESEKIELKTINSINEVNKAVPNVEDYQGSKLSGKNAKSYNGQDYKSTIYQKDMTQNLSYNGIDGYLRFDTQNYSSGDDTSPNNGTDKSSMYYYNIDEGDKNSQQSDGKDVYYYRQRTNTYSKGGQGDSGDSLLNNRAEILSSFEKMSTFKSYVYDENGNVKHQNGEPVENEEEKNNNQKQMIKELMNNAQMVAQTGIIDTEVEYNRKQTIYQGENLNYKLDNLNLGLTERPVAQFSLNNEVDNVEVTLSNGKTLFNTSQSVANLYYSKHQEHNTMYRPLVKDRNQPALLKDTLVNKRIEYKNNKEVAVSEAELIQAYIDDELRAGANMKIRYKMNVKNTGEVDYVDKKFYYTGIEDNPEDLSRISKTNAKKIVDYVGNSIIYDTNMENANNKTKQIETWDIAKYNELIPSTVVEKNKAPVSNNESINNDYINRQYAFETKTYNTILTTNKLSKDLVPMYNENGDSSIGDIYLTVSTEIGMSSDQNKLVYNNMSEVIEMANTLGRRCRYSIVGNEEMADQSLGDNAAETARSSMDRIKPFEIDTDSAQKVLIMPPTGKKIKAVP